MCKCKEKCSNCQCQEQEISEETVETTKTEEDENK
jgi:hypothetical protein